MIPVILNNPEPMLKVRVMTVKDYSEKALKTLHRIGVLHIEEGKELKPVDKAAIESERREVSELLTFANSVLSYLPASGQISLEEDVEVIYTRPFSEIDNEVRTLYNKINKLQQRIVKVNDELQQLAGLKRYLEPLAEQANLRLSDLKFSGDYLFSRTFVLPNEAYQSSHDKLKDYLLENVVAAVEDETVFHAVAKVSDQESIEAIVTAAGGKILPIPDEDSTLASFLEAATDKIGRLEAELARLSEELQSKASADLSRLALLREALSAENERLSVLEKASEAKYVTLIEGWIPESNIEATISEVRQNIDYVFIDTRQPAEQEEPPVKLKNPAGLKPFQTIVNLFATPGYRGWDPTPVIAYSFAFFFGLMVTDVVYALGILLAAKYLLPKFVDDPGTEGFTLFQRLIYISGSVGLVSGLLTGSYLGDFSGLFGIDSLPHVAGVKAMLGDPMSFIVLSLGIGFIHVNLAHVLGLIRGVKDKVKGTVPSKMGLFLLQIGGIPYLMNALFNVKIPLLNAQAYSILSYVLLLGIILIVASSFIQRGAFMGGIFWIFDITGILGDILSYCRLAGVGLATFYLAFSFNMLAGLVSSAIPGVIGAVIGIIAAIVILAFGHILNTVLSGLSGFIHSLRLCFVEFLFKFYEGGGREYSPFKLRKRALVPIGAKS